MRFSAFLSFLGLITFLSLSSVHAQTEVSGFIDIDGTTTWTLANSPYIISASNVTVTENDVLNIESGVVVQFGQNRSIGVEGTLNADGVTFTSSSGTTRGAFGVAVSIRSNGLANIFNSVVQYANTGFALNSGTLTTDNVTVNSSQTGYNIITGNATIRDVDVTDTQYPIRIHSDGGSSQPFDANITYEGTNTFSGNDLDVIYVGFDRNVEFYPNTFKRGNYEFANPGIPYYIPHGQFFVDDTLTIASGTVIKMRNSSTFIVRSGGELIAESEEGSNIYFTSITDDNVGGDSNNDGQATAPTDRIWNGLSIFAGASVKFKRAVVSHANIGLGLGRNALGTSVIDSSRFEDNRFGVSFYRTANTVFSNNEIGTSTEFPVIMDLSADPTFINNSFSDADNNFDAIGINATPLDTNAVLKKIDFTNVSNVTYVLRGNSVINPGRTLTIEPGVVVKSSGYYFDVQGTLIADGTPEEKIVFTSIKDDNYGSPNDTNKDGNASVPGTTDWGGFLFRGGSDASILDNVIVQYGTYNSILYLGSTPLPLYAAVNLIDSDLTLTDSQISNTSGYAVSVKLLSSPTITGNTFTNTANVPVALDLSANPSFNNNTLTNVGRTAIGYYGGNLTTDGTFRNIDFAGFESITTVLLDFLTVKSGATLSIDPGTVIKTDKSIVVEGGFNSAGTADSLIYITSLRDDQVGNPQDTNGDGGATQPAARDWWTVWFKSTADDAASELSHTVLRYNRHGTVLTGASPTIDNLMIQNCAGAGIGIEQGSTVSVANSSIEGCGHPLAVSLSAEPTFSGNTISGNGSNGILLLDATNLTTSFNAFNYGGYFQTSNTITSSDTLSSYSFAGFDNVPFIAGWYMTVGNGAKLSIDPGVIIKGTSGSYYWTVNGALKSLGTDENPVIFTSYADDSAGGDTNNDGNTSVPNVNQMFGLRFQSSDIDSANHVRYTEFRYPQTPFTFIDAYAKVENNLVQLSSYPSLDIQGTSNPDILNNRFENITNRVVFMDMFSNPTFSGNIESNVSKRGIGIQGDNWTQDATIPFRSFAGVDSVTYVLGGNMNITTDTEITFPAGLVFKKESSLGFSLSSRNYSMRFSGFVVDGSVKVNGTPEKPVIFTIDTDDSFGYPADIHGDGNNPEPNFRAGSWFTFNATIIDSANVIDHAIFRNAESTIVLNNAAPTFSNTTFEFAKWGINLNGISEPIVENNTFNDLQLTPFIGSILAYPSSTSGNNITGTTYKAISIKGETLVQDYTLPKRNFGGINGIPYFFDAGYTVGTGAVLTIEPGVIIKNRQGFPITVNRGLVAEGGSTPDSAIVFTTIFDDFYGGNTDFTYTNPAQFYSWSGIRFTSTALPEFSKLDNVIIRYTGAGFYGMAGVIADNSSPTITNSSLNNNYIGVEVRGSGNPIVTNNDIYDNIDFGINNRDQTFVIDATNNWWGNDSGPTHSGNPGGSGDTVSDAVNYNPFIGGGASNPILGDVSLNGDVQAFDAAKILRAVALLETLSASQEIVADVSGNGTVSSMDASYILQYAVGLIEAFPAELNSKLRNEKFSYPGLEQMQLSFGELIEISEEEFIVPIILDNVNSLYAFELELDYDDQNLELVESNISAIWGDKMISDNTTEPGSYILAAASTELVEESGKVLELTFRNTNPDASPSLSIKRFTANEIDLTETAISNEELTLNVPETFTLHQNYPNPFNPSTTIGFDVPNINTLVKLEIYNILGQKVKTLVNDVYAAGRYSVKWDGTNDAGVQVSTGVYIYRVQAGNVVQSKKLTFIK